MSEVNIENTQKKAVEKFQGNNLADFETDTILPMLGGRDTVYQEMKGLDTIAPKLINQTLKEVDRVAEARIRQLINKGDKQVKKIAPKIIRGAIEDVYKKPFRLLGNFGNKKLAQVKRKLLDIVRK